MATSAKPPTCKQLMTQLKKVGKDSHRRTFIRHGAPEDPNLNWGVPVAELKKFQKQIRKDYELSKQLYATGNADAQYLAGLIADPEKMTRTDLKRWAREACWDMIRTWIVSGVAAESPHAVALGTKWIDSRQERIAMIGWPTLGGYVSITPDEEIDLKLFQRLLDRCVKEIHGERNEVKDAMNSFVMSVGCYVVPLKDKALAAARKIGVVEVDHGDTACKTHVAEAYIMKNETMGRIGRKRKSARC